MHSLVPIIIIVIICLQVFFFVKNLLRMEQFKNIFSESESWSLRRNTLTGLVDGVFGSGNSIFTSIKESINKYLGNNSGSVIDFGLLKDAVDRHCDSVENDIANQTPIPLYWGLAGTMAGVIMGLWDLIGSDAILKLMTGGSTQIDANAKIAAQGINSLLVGVAWAMAASICGIILTTINSILFKRCKLHEESGKNSFLAWMQSELLPELPSDTSEALNNLVVNLNEFNSTFAENTANLGSALEAVNQSYAIQADIIRMVHEMDVVQMSNANVRVLQELKECTDKLELFNEYLDSIEGYTDAIESFERQFHDQADRLHVLEEIRDFFRDHKGSIAKTTADADNALKTALSQLQSSTTDGVREMQRRFVEQSEHFKSMIAQEKEAFEQFMSQLNAQFSSQMSQIPQMARHFEEISAIPSHLDKLIEKVEKSNKQMAEQVASALEKAVQTASSPSHRRTHSDGNGPAIVAGPYIPSWMKWTGLIALVIIAAACVFNAVTYFIPKSEPVQIVAAAPQVSEAATVVTPSTTTDNDSVKNGSVTAAASKDSIK